MSENDTDVVLLHILVVGFHHQRGTQVRWPS